MSKGRKIASWILAGLVSAIMILSAVGKLTAGPDAMIAQNFVKWGLEGKLVPIGISELLIGILFLIPLTSSLGILLVTAHFSGAIATHLQHAELSVIPIPAIILFVAWVGYYLRHPEMLISFFKSKSFSHNNLKGESK